MTAQLRKASCAVGLAIAEGCGRGSNPDFVRFLFYSNGSAEEVEYGADLSIDLEFARVDDLRAVMALSVEVQKMLRSLIAHLRAGS